VPLHPHCRRTVLAVALFVIGAVGPLAAQLPVDAKALVPRHDSMTIRVGGVAIGWRTSSLQRIEGGLRVVELFSAGEFGEQRTEILLAPDGRVRQVQQGGVLSGVPIRTSLEYRRNRVRGVTVVTSRQGPLTITADTTIPAGTIDDNAVALFLPTLPWDVGARWTFLVFDGETNSVQPMTLAVLGTASLSLAQGTEETWEAELTGGPNVVRYYITRSAPHRVARMVVVGTQVELLLVN
jgi:hypothetical protein